MPGPQERGISYSRLGPMDPDQVRQEIAGEISPPAKPPTTLPRETAVLAADNQRPRRLRRRRRLRHR